MQTHTARFTVNLTPEMLRDLNALAARSHLSAAALARQAIANFLANPVVSLPVVLGENKHVASRNNAKEGQPIA